jgi:hypothetical protein
MDGPILRRLHAPLVGPAMTIYFMGSEDVDFIVHGTISTPGSSGYHRSAWQRTSIAIQNSGAVDPPANRIQTTNLGPLTSLWAHAQVFWQPGAPTNGQQIMRFLDASNNCKLALRSSGTYGVWGIWTRTNAGTWTQLGANFTNTIPVSTQATLDIDVVYGTSGSVSVYTNGAQVFTYSGDVTTDGNANIQSVEFADAFGGGNPENWSEIIVADSDTRSMNLLILNPGTLTTGTLAQWTGTANNVNTAWINDANFISSATAAQIQDYHTISALPAGVYSVLAVSLVGRASVSTTGPQHIQLGLNFNGTRFWTSNLAPALTFTNFPNNIWNTNPATGVAWTPADIVAATFNFSLQSVT